MTLNEVKSWVKAALADGWEKSPIYKGESIDTAMNLEKDGFMAMAYMRSEQNCSVSVWGPDKLQVSVPEIYSFDKLQQNTHKCDYCEREFMETQRLGFAGRVCAKCHAENVAKVEYRGWCD
jgi:hypothetical protein